MLQDLLDVVVVVALLWEALGMLNQMDGSKLIACVQDWTLLWSVVRPFLDLGLDWELDDHFFEECFGQVWFPSCPLLGGG